MRLTLHTTKTIMAVAVSLWMAGLACVMGCTQPALASSPTIVDASPSQKNSAHHSQSALTADMPNCHHSGDNSSLPRNGRKPASNGAVSCCPLEITVVQKWTTVGLRTARMQEFALFSEFHFGVARFSGPSEFAQSIYHCGRDTLLETHLLRI